MEKKGGKRFFFFRDHRLATAVAVAVAAAAAVET